MITCENLLAIGFDGLNGVASEISHDWDPTTEFYGPLAEISLIPAKIKGEEETSRRGETSPPPGDENSLAVGTDNENKSPDLVRRHIRREAKTSAMPAARNETGRFLKLGHLLPLP